MMARAAGMVDLGERLCFIPSSAEQGQGPNPA